MMVATIFATYKNGLRHLVATTFATTLLSFFGLQHGTLITSLKYFPIFTHEKCHCDVRNNVWFPTIYIYKINIKAIPYLSSKNIIYFLLVIRCNQLLLLQRYKEIKEIISFKFYLCIIIWQLS
jgi:hypothetical protein